jgi:hypothetical protein
MYTKLMMSSAITLALLLGCTDQQKEKSLTEGGMKCGAGKCGASMVDGSAVLVKKKMNILDQLKEGDNRRDCVLKASSTKILYDCVRVAETGRLSTKCSTGNTKKVQAKEVSSMKCEAGKCESGR